MKIFKYIEPIWLGTNNKLSIRKVMLASNGALSINEA
jgi:hypothetical protein